MDYEYTDKIIEYIDKQLIRMFSGLKGIVSFDELNVMQNVDKLYSEIEEMVKKSYIRLADRVYRDNIRKTHNGSLDEQWVDALLNAYDPVSKYVFEHELDRRRARLIEAVLASDTKTEEIDAALRSMSLMCRIYADRVTDEAVLKAYLDDGERYVLWVAEKDSRTCKVCKKRDGTVYAIDKVPKDPHYNCRCKRERVSLWEIVTRKHSAPK